MKKRIISIMLLLAISALAFSACAKENLTFVDKVYIYEKLSTSGDAFTITINEDGTFKYDEGSQASYKGEGTWTYSDGVLCLTDALDENYTIQNYFQIVDGCLVFVSDQSTNFVNVSVTDGEKFIDISAE